MNNCPICSSLTETVFQLKDFPVIISSLPEKFNLKRIKSLDDLYIEKCINCGFISNRKQEADFYKNLYTNTPKFHAKKSQIHWKKIFEKFKPKNILEIGGGINNIGSILNENTNLSVLDYSIEEVELNQKKQILSSLRKRLMNI